MPTDLNLKTPHDVHAVNVIRRFCKENPGAIHATRQQN